MCQTITIVFQEQKKLRKCHSRRIACRSLKSKVIQMQICFGLLLKNFTSWYNWLSATKVLIDKQPEKPKRNCPEGNQEDSSVATTKWKTLSTLCARAFRDRTKADSNDWILELPLFKFCSEITVCISQKVGTGSMDHGSTHPAQSLRDQWGPLSPSVWSWV